jgi:O-antigen/teichoic acid export membrane protein
MTDHARSIVLVARNSTWNLAAFATSVLSNLMLLPYVVNLIGIQRFGTCGLLISVTTPLSLIGSVLGQTVCQSVARSRAQSDQALTHDACAAVAAMGIILIPAGAIVLAGVIPIVIAGLSSTDSSTLESIPLLTLLLALAWIAQQASLIMQGVHVACMAYRRIAAINAIGAAFNLAFGIIGVTANPTVVGYLGAICAAQMATSLAWFLSLLLHFRWALARPSLTKRIRRVVLAFSGWLTVSQLVSGLSAQADRYVLGAVSSTVSIGYLNVAQRVEEAAYSVMLKAADTLFPYFSSTSGDAQAHSRFYFTVTWLMNLTAAAAIAPLVPLAPSILSVWVNAETAIYASVVLRTLAVAGLLGCASHVFRQYMLGSSRTRQYALLNIAVSAVVALGAFILLPKYGLRAAGVGAVAASAVQLAFVIQMVRRHFGAIGIDAKILNSTIVPVGLAIATSYGLTRCGFQFYTWPSLIGAYVTISTGLILLILLINALTAEGRRLLIDLRRLASSAREHLLFKGDHEALVAEAMIPKDEETVAGVDMSPPA